jgi:DnaJ-class molecular chaperone
MTEVRKVKVECGLCDGRGLQTRKEYGSGKQVIVKCSTCSGRGWFEYEAA